MNDMHKEAMALATTAIRKAEDEYKCHQHFLVSNDFELRNDVLIFCLKYRAKALESYVSDMDVKVAMLANGSKIIRQLFNMSYNVTRNINHLPGK